MQKCANCLGRHVGEDSKDADVLVEFRVNCELGDGAGTKDRAVVDLNVDSHFGEWGDVRRVKRIKRGRADLNSSVSPEQFRVKEHADLWNDVVAGDYQRAHQIVFAIGAGFKDRDLRAGDDDRLAEIFEHKGER